MYTHQNTHIDACLIPLYLSKLLSGTSASKTVLMCVALHNTYIYYVLRTTTYYYVLRRTTTYYVVLRTHYVRTTYVLCTMYFVLRTAY